MGPRIVPLHFILVLCLPQILSGARNAAAAGKLRQPVYVGAKACGQCHDGKPMGNQLTAWLHSKHARTYASLAEPEAPQIARWSGITTEPQQSPLCLGCHATGAEAEPWEKDDTFFVRDGIQCEKCHGPGSEYLDAKLMMNRQAAMMAGLNMPTKDDCMNCHVEKGSHRMVLGPRSFDPETACRQIAHPRPGDWQFKKLQAPQLALKDNPGTRYVGAAACARCHSGPPAACWRLAASTRE